jgi:hypothetical protein
MILSIENAMGDYHIAGSWGKSTRDKRLDSIPKKKDGKIMPLPKYSV